MSLQRLAMRALLTGAVLVVAIASLPAQEPARALMSPDVDSLRGKTCISEGCHAPGPDRGIPQHVPYLEGHCLACHEDHASTEPQLLRPGGDEVCLKCHTFESKTTDTAQAGHGTDGRACLDCHAPHESRIRGLLRDEKTLLECADCHKDFLEKAGKLPYRHQHFELQTACGDCHYAHRNAGHKFLRDNVTGTCLTCHDLPIREGDRTLEDVARELRTLPVRHAAISQGGCPACHTPHGSTQPSLLLAGYPEGRYETYRRDDYALCWRCHNPNLVEGIDGRGVTDFRNGDKNLHRVHVVELKNGRACHLCHEAHASSQAHLMRQHVRFGQWDAPLVWTERPDGGGCATPCHRDRFYLR